jgi:hypothetical protein
LASNVAWLNATLVQLDNFWTSNTLIWDTWQHFKQGLFCVYIRKQLSYIVLIGLDKMCLCNFRFLDDQSLILGA